MRYFLIGISILVWFFISCSKDIGKDDLNITIPCPTSEDSGNKGEEALTPYTVLKLVNIYWEDGRCALFSDDRLKCWGPNKNGALGYGNTKAYGDEPKDMGRGLLYVNLGDDYIVDVMETSPQFHDMCVILGANRRVKCWGGSYLVAPVSGSTPNKTPDKIDYIRYTDNTYLEDVKALSGGGQNICALLLSGDIVCWGYNNYGQLGYEDTVLRTKPENGSYVNLGTGLKAKKISCSEGICCAIVDDVVDDSDDDKLKCWGRNDRGQLGYGDTNNRGDQAGEMGDSLPFVDVNAPVGIGLEDRVKDVSVGGYIVCVVDMNDNAKCWGAKDNGLGIGATEDIGDDEVPASISSLPFDLSVKKIRTGPYHTCAILSNDKIKCFGDNCCGALGYGDETGRSDVSKVPYVDLGEGYQALDIIVDQGHNTCALLSNGMVKCWGNNDRGTLGLGDTEHRGDDPGEMGDNLPYIRLK